MSGSPRWALGLLGRFIDWLIPRTAFVNEERFAEARWYALVEMALHETVAAHHTEGPDRCHCGAQVANRVAHNRIAHLGRMLAREIGGNPLALDALNAYQNRIDR